MWPTIGWSGIFSFHKLLCLNQLSYCYILKKDLVAVAVLVY